MSASPIARAGYGDEPAGVAARWYADLTATTPLAGTPEQALPAHPPATLAAFADIALTDARTLLILVPDDTLLPELSNVLDIALRPLCLVLPGADFAARTALRATLALLKSRLRRDGDEEQPATWTRQRQRLAEQAPLWQEAQDWAAREDRSDVPLRVAALFPVCIMPLAACRALQHQAVDIALLYRCDAPPELTVTSGRLLRIGARAATARPRAIVRDDAEARLRLEQAQLARDVADLELELVTVQGEVAEFMQRYYELVGRRMAERDALQALRADQQAARAPDDPRLGAEARHQRQRAEQSAAESRHFAEATAEEPAAFRPGNDIKRLFRQVAQQIHPDRAVDEADRAWRTGLMSEANRAYRHGDERALREVAALWREAGGARGVAAGTPVAATLRRQVGRLRARLAEIERELHRLFGSRLYELFIAARQARRQGRDLLTEMAQRLETEIAELQTAHTRPN